MEKLEIVGIAHIMKKIEKGETMPKYDFKCQGCGEVKEKIVSWTESEKRFFCERCGTLSVRRIFSPQGIVFQVRWGKPRVRAKVKKMGA